MDVAHIPLRLPDVLTDGDIRLDPHTLADAEPHAAGEDHEMRLRFDHPEPATPTPLERQRLGVQSWIDARAAFGPNIVYALRDASGDQGGRLMGGCEIRLLTADSANVSYWIYPPFRGRGHAARALRLLCAAAAQIPGLARLEAHIDVDNLASRRVALAAGFSEDGTVDDEAWTGAVSTRTRFVRAPG